MTHKATLVSLHRLALAGLAESALPRERIVKLRRFFVTSEINDLLSGRVQANPEFPCGKASHQIGIFVRGNIVGVSRTHKSKCELKWLDGHDEAWVFSIREPRPGWRIFGRFASKNVFVGLHCVTREEAGDVTP